MAKALLQGVEIKPWVAEKLPWQLLLGGSDLSACVYTTDCWPVEGWEGRPGEISMELGNICVQRGDCRGSVGAMASQRRKGCGGLWP